MEIVYAGKGVVGERCRKILWSLVPSFVDLVEGQRVPPCDVLWSVHWPHLFTPRDLAQARLAALNVHNSYLPWNRGADSCWWALHYADNGKPDGFRHGATVHWMDEGIDTGPICWQREVEVYAGDTPEILYDRTANEEVWLFTQVTRALLAGDRLAKEPQVGVGTFHRRGER